MDENIGTYLAGLAMNPEAEWEYLLTLNDKYYLTKGA